jgi:hypothetical protein
VLVLTWCARAQEWSLSVRIARSLLPILVGLALLAAAAAHARSLAYADPQPAPPERNGHFPAGANVCDAGYMLFSDGRYVHVEYVCPSFTAAQSRYLAVTYLRPASHRAGARRH